MSILKEYKNTHEHKWRTLGLRVVLVLLTVFLIVWFMPKHEAQQFVFGVDEPWHYGTIIAKYDFPIYKTEEAIQEERDSLLSQFQPYYDYDEQVEKNEIEKLKTDLKGITSELPAGTEAIIIDRLHRLYQAGIMSTPDYNSFRRDTTSAIRVIFGKNAESIQIGCVYSTMSAYEQLLTDEVLSKDRPLLQRLNLNNYIEPNLIFDRAKTTTAKNDLLSGISQASGMVMAGERIISQGDMVTEAKARVLYSWMKETQRRQASNKQLSVNLVGKVIYVFILVSLFTLYLALFRKDYFEKARSIAMIYSWLVIFPVLTSFLMEHSYFSMSVYVLPFALVPIFVRVFMDSRTAFMTHVTMILICASMVKFQFEFIVLQLVAGMVAIFSLREMLARAQVFRTALLVFLSNCITLFTLRLMLAGSTVMLDYSFFYHFMINGVLLLLSYPLMYLVEKLFGFTSVITLIELSNTNKGLLRRLSEEAPGTFMHSITVGNLAAEIANKIGAKSTLVRTGALYHDIGKLYNPAYFTENQEGNVSPFDNLTEKEGAAIIIKHVTEGIRLAEENNLPVVLQDFIRTHHGRGITKYFYVKYQNAHPDELVDKTPFMYPGPNPSTREQAILMMADTCEAASHSLQSYTEESISELVNRLIDQQVKDGLYNECRITFYDIAMAKQVLTERLKAIYHTRIQYPKSKVEEKPEEKPEVAPTPAAEE